MTITAPVLCPDPDTGRGDIRLSAEGDLQAGSWLETAVYLSLFTDASVAVPIEGYRGGYWGDGLRSYSLGSELWRLRREKITEALLADIKDIASVALAWLVDDGHIRDLSLSVTRNGLGKVDLLIKLFLNTGEQESYRYGV